MGGTDTKSCGGCVLPDTMEDKKPLLFTALLKTVSV